MTVTTAGPTFSTTCTGVSESLPTAGALAGGSIFGCGGVRLGRRRRGGLPGTHSVRRQWSGRAKQRVRDRGPAELRDVPLPIVAKGGMGGGDGHDRRRIGGGRLVSRGRRCWRFRTLQFIASAEQHLTGITPGRQWSLAD